MVTNYSKLTRGDYIQLFLNVLVLVILLEVIGYQGLGHWLYRYLWSSTKYEWVLHTMWLLIINVPVTFGLIVRQVKVERRFQMKLYDSQEEFRSLFFHNSASIFAFDVQGNITNANPAAEVLTGYDLAELTSRHRHDFLSEAKRMVAAEYFGLALNGHSPEFENTLIHKDGHTIDVRSRNIPIYRGGEVVGVYALLSNITENKQFEREIRKLAYSDHLTGLGNRRQFYLESEKAIEQARVDARRLGLLLIDLDRFKNVNDTLGHDIGDQVLVAIANRMASSTHTDNVLARMGGDEFVLVVPNVEDINQVKMIANRILDAIQAPLFIQNYKFHLSASIGIAVFPEHSNSVTGLLKAADSAMYDAKALGKSTTCVYQPSLSASAYSRLELETDLRQALLTQSAELFVEFQPQISIVSNSIVGAEALARWSHPKYGLIEPGEFIPLAEEIGLISALGKHVTRTVCRQIEIWREQTPYWYMPISINLSQIQLRESDLVSQLVEILGAHGVPTSCIRIEVTESSLIQDEKLVVEQLALLRQLGFDIFVDDFGKGYSSFASLKHFSLDGIKIDKYFIDAMDKNPNDAAIVDTLIKLANALHLQVIAEGVERSEQLARLKQFGCNQYQGFLYSRPLASEEFIALVADRKSSAHDFEGVGSSH